MTAVKSLLTALTEAGVPAIFGNTGGGCHAIIIDAPNGGEVLITDSEDVFSDGDLTSDEDVSGFYVTINGPDGAPSTLAEADAAHVYASPTDAPDYTLGSDIPAVVAAVKAALARVSA